MVLVERSHPAPKSLAIEARKQNGKYNKAGCGGEASKRFS
jgi:hypothetical protein